MKYIRFLFFALAMLLANTSCKKAEIAQKPPPIPPPDPCDSTRIGTKYTTSSFRILETIRGTTGIGECQWVDYETDTFCTGELRFVANVADDSVNYTWRIGAGVYNTKSVYLKIPFDYVGQRIYATLVVRSTRKNRICPNDDGADSITKSVVYVSKPKFSTKINLLMKNTIAPYNSDSFLFDYYSYNVVGDSSYRHRGKVKLPPFNCWVYDGLDACYAGYRQIGWGYGTDTGCFRATIFLRQQQDTLYLSYYKWINYQGTQIAYGKYYYTPYR